MAEQVGHPPNDLAASLLEAALEATADGILIVDRQGRIVRFNRRFAEMWRIPDAILASGEDRQALEHVLRQLEDPEGFLRQVQALYAAPEAESYDVLRFTDGRTFERVSRPQRLGDEIVGRVWSFRDVTDRERAESSARRQAAQMTALGALTRALMQSLELAAVASELLKAVQVLIPGAAVRLREYEADGETLRLVGSAGLSGAGMRTRTRLGDGLAGQAALQRTILISPDVATDPRYISQEWAITQGVSSCVAIPLIYGERLSGVMCIYTCERHAFAEEEMDLLRVLADDAAVAMEHARVHHASVRRAQQLESLLRALKTVTSGLDLREILDQIIAEAARIARTPHVKLLLLEEAAQGLRMAVARGGIDHPNFPAPLAQSLSGTVAATGQPLFVADSQDESRNPNAAFDRQMGLRTYLGLPIRGRHGVLGVVTFNTTEPRTYSEEELSYLASFADQAAIAIENARLYDTAQRELADRREAEGVLQRRTMQLEAVRTVGMELTRDLDLTHLLERVVREAAGLLGAVSGAVWLWNPVEAYLEPGAFLGHDPAWFAAIRLRLGEGVTGTVAQRRTGLIVSDVHRSPLRAPAFRDRATPEGVMVEPLLYQDRMVGTISLDRYASDPPFTAQDAEVLRLFAAQAAIAIENARLYEAVKTHAATLETRVAERTDEVTAALREAEAGGRAKTNFLLNISHELRTPLNAVLGFSQLLQGQVAAHLNAKQARYLDHIHESGKHLLELINEILDLGKVEAGQTVLQCEAVEVAPLVDGAVTLVGEIARRKSLAVHAEIATELPSVWADPVRLKQILFNLLTNAVKFTPDGGRITVTARRICDFRLPIADLADQNPEPQSQVANPTSQRGDFLEIAVADTGIGITPEDLPRLFTEFTQLEAAATKHHAGTGIGLALSKRLVELHGGTITASSPGEGKGSTFTIRLPFGGPDGKSEE